MRCIKCFYQGREIYVRCCIARNPTMESVNVLSVDCWVLCEIHRVNLKCNEMFNLFFIISFANRHDILSNLSLFYSSENLLNLFPEGWVGKGFLPSCPQEVVSLLKVKIRESGGMTPWWYHLWPAPDRGVLPHGKERRPFFCEGTRLLVGDHLSVVHTARPGKERLSTTLW